MNCLYVAALGTVDEHVMLAMAASAALAFHLDWRRTPALPEPDYAWDAVRGQYCSVPMLRATAACAPLGAAKVLAVTEKDIFIPMLSFVYGQAQLAGRFALVSLARLRQEHYRLPPNTSLLDERARKEAIHEVGHTFGLLHCPNPACAMALSTTIVHLDRKRAGLCAACSSEVS